MARITYYAVLPFTRVKEGDLVALEALDARDRAQACRIGFGLAVKHGGAVAFSRAGDPALGEFEDAVILGRYGDVPEDLATFTG